MAYNRKNLLKKIISIQNITLEQTNKGVTQQYVYEELVFPVFGISKSTYYRYLAINAKKELAKITDTKDL